MACKYHYKDKTFNSEEEFKDYIHNNFNEVKSDFLKTQTFKPEDNAIQEQSAGSVLQYPQEGVGEKGSERVGVESSVQGKETTGTRKEEQRQLSESGQKEETFGLAFAPYREKNVTSIEEDTQIRNSKDYQLHQENVQNIADELGIKIKDKSDTWGGYVDTETGKPVQEVSNVIYVETTPEKAKLFAALLGQSAPEMQDSVLLGNYHEEGNGTEFNFQFNNEEDAKAALDAMKSNGLQYFTLNPKTHQLTILDTDNSSLGKIRSFISNLTDNGIASKINTSKVNAEFIGRQDYAGIIGEGIRHQEGSKKGFNPNAFVEESKRRYAALKNENQKVPTQGSEVSHTESQTKQVITKATELFDQIQSAEGAAKKRRLAQQRRTLLEANPTVKYLDDHIGSIYKQLEEKKLITKKGKCP